MMKYKAAVFDLDGTLLDTLEDLTDSVNHILEKYEWPLCTLQQVRSYVGNGLGKTMERAGPEGAVTDEIKSEFQSWYAEHCSIKTEPYDGVAELLEKLSQNGIKIAVASNKDDAAVKELTDFHFGKSIEISCGSGREMQRKPAPDMVNAILKAFSLRAEEIVYIGDSEVDAQTAANAGADCILVTWGFRDKEQLQKLGRTADTPQEVLKLILDN